MTKGNNIYINKKLEENILKVDESNSIKNSLEYHDLFINSKVYSTRKRELYGAWNNCT